MTQTRVRDLMKKNPVMIPPDCTLKEAAQQMESVDCGALPVGTPDNLEGVITDRDIVLRAVAKGKDVNREKVRDYMTADVCFISEDDTTDKVATMMHDRNINRVLVKDRSGKPTGILTFGRLIRQNQDKEELTSVIECAVGKKAA